MEQTTIQSITPQGTWTGANGIMHKSDVILENGLVGEVNAKTPDRWKVGDAVVVKSHQQTKWGPRLSLTTPEGANKPATAPSQPRQDNRQESIVTQWAIREAQTYLFNGAKAPDKVTLYELWGVAKQLKSMHDNFDSYGKMYKEQTSQRAQEVAPENCPPVPEQVPTDEDLPF